MEDLLLRELQKNIGTGDDFDLSRRFAPRLRFDNCEPFLPLVVGCTVFRSAAKSPSSKFMIDPADGVAIEYAIWWDWDIQHLYELEHIWVYLDVEEQLVSVKASAHGAQLEMVSDDGTLPVENGRVTVFSEPGKHGFAPERHWLVGASERINECCGTAAGEDGILTSNPFGAAAFGNLTLFEHRLAKRYMQRLAFAPSYDFSKVFDLRSIPLITWTQLQEWIPRRMQWWRGELVRTVPHLRLICLDSGDTLVDEATEFKDGEVTLHAELIPDAAAMVQQLAQEGYTLALVADGPRATFENVLKNQYNLWNFFSCYTISGDVGCTKPDARMFQTVLNELNIVQVDYARAVMVGNNLERDIKGANALGLISVLISWSPRRSKIPSDSSEVPNYTIQTPLELLPLLEKIELNLSESDTH
jgi:HAD superfamily hydrolase (TIGR01549 family)